MNVASKSAATKALAIVDRYAPAIKSSLPSHMAMDRFVRTCKTAVSLDANLLRCEPKSLVGALVQAAQLGLEIGPLLGHCYLVPYKGKVQLQIGYKGMIDLARRSGQIKSVSARLVDSADEFEFEYGLEEKLRHVPSREPTGQIVAVYAIATFAEGGHQMEVLTMRDIETARSSAQSRKVWDAHFGEMARKTAIRKLFKYLPISIELARATTLDELGENGVEQNLDADIEPLDAEYEEIGNESLGQQSEG